MELKRIGFAERLVSHGLRSMPSTSLNEQGFDRDIIVVALAHVDDNHVRIVFTVNYFERRRPMIGWRSEYIVSSPGGNTSLIEK